MKKLICIIAIMFAFCLVNETHYGVRESSFKTDSGTVAVHKFPDTTLTILLKDRAISHVQFDFKEKKLYGNTGKLIECKLIDPIEKPEE